MSFRLMFIWVEPHAQGIFIVGNRRRAVAYTGPAVENYHGLRWNSSKKEPQTPSNKPKPTKDEQEYGGLHSEAQGVSVFDALRTCWALPETHVRRRRPTSTN